MNIFETKKSVKEHLVELTKQLIRFPSHAGELQKIVELVEFIKAYFEKENVVVKNHIFNGVPSLVITTHETKHPNILLAGHIDVVPSSTRYIAEEEAGWLYGSGSMDMKGGVAVMMALLKYFSRQKNPLSLGIMLTSDEEVGSHHGTIPLLEQEGYRANFIIINEGRHAYDIVTREKGILLIKFVTTGEYIHSAYPWKAKNSIQELMKFLIDIQKIFPRPSDAWVSTASVTVFRGGEETNTIPGHAEAFLNIRLTGGARWTRDIILEKIEKRLTENITIQETHYGEIFFASARNRYIRLLKRATEAELERKIAYGENHGTSDARLFMHAGLPAAILGPVGKNHHTPHEAVEIESLVNHFYVLKKFISDEETQAQKRAKKLTA